MDFRGLDHIERPTISTHQPPLKVIRLSCLWLPSLRMLPFDHGRSTVPARLTFFRDLPVVVHRRSLNSRFLFISGFQTKKPPSPWPKTKRKGLFLRSAKPRPYVHRDRTRRDYLRHYAPHPCGTRPVVKPTLALTGGGSTRGIAPPPQTFGSTAFVPTGTSSRLLASEFAPAAHPPMNRS